MVGILGLQGGVGLHVEVCRKLGHEVREVRDPSDLAGLDALILPGGESTTQGLLLERRGLLEPLKAALRAGLPTLGTCAGAILLATDIENSGQHRLGLLDVTVRRNAYGSQIDSFDTPVDVVGLGRVPAVFIRAPQIVRVGPRVEVLSSYQGHPILVRQGSLVAATFHPELTDSFELHQWFLALTGRR